MYAAIETFLSSEQHKASAEAYDALIDEVGDGHSLSKQQLQGLIGKRKGSGPTGAPVGRR